MTSAHFDVFNGDADGLCALVQRRLAEPIKSTLITGVKRDLALLQRVPVDQASGVTVLDLNFASNRDAVEALLAHGVPVTYVDHHNPGGELPRHPLLHAMIETEATVCTSLLVDRHLAGAYADWATVAAFGDNLRQVALARCQGAALNGSQVEQLELMGICLNYNGYGATLEDLHFHPAALFERMVRHASPWHFMAAESDTWGALSEGYRDDMARGMGVAPWYQSEQVAVICLPDQAWARRVNGVLGNALANAAPARAHAIVTQAGEGACAISIRAPLQSASGADELAVKFPTGGGRKGAAGINQLPLSRLDDFVAAMSAQWR